MRERRKDYEIQFIKDHVESVEDLPERNRHQIRGSIAQSMAVSESGRDQRKADLTEQNGSRSSGRIRIVTLLGLAFIGGSIGSLLAMYLLRHKTRKDYFTVGVPLIIVMQVVVIFYMMNAGW